MDKAIGKEKPKEQRGRKKCYKQYSNDTNPACVNCKHLAACRRISRRN